MEKQPTRMDAGVVEPSAAWTDQWRDALGRGWRWQLVLIALLLFVAGFSLPFSDPDFPIHLATGEWVAKHHAVPITEPFAWTRAGAPFQAYSWAMELMYYELMSHVGPFGLSVLQGTVYVALAAVMVVLGRAARWNPWVTLVMIAGNLIVTLGATPHLRPQSILLIATPLAWALVYRSLETPRLALTLAGLTVVSAVMANTHLLFPIAAVPCVLLLVHFPADRKRFVLVPGAIVLGWFLSPYALHWPSVFALNFARNPLIGPPSGLGEYQPGFQSVIGEWDPSTAIAMLLTFLPWIAAGRLNARARMLYGVLWFAGLLLFALAVRSLIVWWLVTLPVLGLALSMLQTPTLPSVRTAQRAIVLAVFALVAIAGLESRQDPALRSGDVRMRYLPSITARSIEPIALWLDCHVRHDVGGKLVTTFNYGGYVPWRLSYLSESIDGRTIFPDSVAKPEAYFLAHQRSMPLPPWRTADLAIFPVAFPVAAVLDSAQGWHRVAMTSQLDGPARMIALWVTDKWWSRAGASQLPRGVLPLMQSLEPRAASCATLTAGSM